VEAADGPAAVAEDLVEAASAALVAVPAAVAAQAAAGKKTVSIFSYGLTTGCSICN
jgi:hypothetical protein